MKAVPSSRIQLYLKNKKNRKRWRTLVTVLTSAVVFGTSYLLILPAVTMEEATCCGLAEHPEHTADCYTVTKLCSCGDVTDESGTRVLICGQAAEAGHVHTEECYHVHTEECFEQTLICELPLHEHSADCYQKPETEAEEATTEEESTELTEETPAESDGESAAEPNEESQEETGETAPEEPGETGESESETGETGSSEGPSDGESQSAQEPAVTTVSCVTEDGRTVSVTGRLPEGAEVRVEAVPAEVLAELLARLGAEAPAFAYDITIIDGNGAEWQPEALGAEVVITDLSVAPDRSLEIVHVPEEGEPESVEATVSDGNASFTATGFSIYLGYTVDFHYEGLSFSIPGEGQVLLSEVFDALQIPREASAVTALRFSDPALLTIEQQEEDWLLTSLVPFDTEETLFLTFADGKEVELLVTDARSETVKATTTVDIEVNVSWNEGETPDAGSIAVTLLKDGVSTDNNLVLSNSNNWQGAFRNQPAGSYSIDSTLQNITARVIQKNPVQDSQTKSTAAKVSSLTNNKKYVIVFGTNQALKNSAGTALSKGTVTISGDNVTAVPDDCLWTYDGTAFKNVATGNYLVLNGSGASLSASTRNKTTNNSGKLYQSSGGKNYYLVGSTTGSYSTTTDNGSATAFTLYQQSASATVETITYSFQGATTVFQENTIGDDLFRNEKKIDYLGDGTANADTDANGVDDYRLYLNMNGEQLPVDLVIVVDGSSSMESNKDIDNMRRDYAVTKFLNGTLDKNDTAALKDGFIDYFLNLNDENMVSVVRFYGDPQYGTGNISTSKVSYTADADVLKTWTSKNSYVDCSRKTLNPDNGQGTDYEAGLLMASDMFADKTVKNNGHRKMMLFLSDGNPTFFLINNNDVGLKVSNSTISSSDVGKRGGTGGTTTMSYCVQPTKTAFDEFMSANPGVMVFTVGIGDFSGTSDTTSTEVLTYMATKGGGAFMIVNESMAQIQLELEAIFFPCRVTIEDKLSKYVRYNSDNPDVVISMIEVGTGKETDLYRNGARTAAADGILQSFSYTPGDTSARPTSSTGSFKVTFDPMYLLMPTYDYTVSFNVVPTDTAFEEYRLSGYPVKGDAGTDYKSNSTSSNKDGFYSNDEARVYYTVGKVDTYEKYDKPVVQVRKVVLTVNEHVTGIETTKQFPVRLIVRDKNGDPVDYTGVTLPAGVTAAEGSTPGVKDVLSFTMGNGDSVVLDGVLPIGAQLELVEEDHNNFRVSMKLGDTGTFSGDDQSFSIPGDMTVDIYNVTAVDLPETGGPGTLPLTLAGLLLILGAFSITLIRKKESL